MLINIFKLVFLAVLPNYALPLNPFIVNLANNEYWIIKVKN